MSLPFLAAADVAQRLGVAAAVDALEAALLAGLDPEADPPRSALALAGGELLVMPSAAGGHAAVKLVTVGGEPRIQGVCVVFCPAGPVMEYMPDKVKQVPTTAEELLAWAKANPNRFLYARPANSGPGRVFMMGLPYILGDKDPKDPVNGWDKTWAYLKELGQYIEYYPGGTGPVMKELGEGSRDMVPSQMGWDINPRALGVVPKEAKVFFLKGFHWILDAHYLCIPKGVSNDKLAVLLDMLNYLLSKDAQATTYDAGYFYPGPAVKDVPITMAPEESQKIIKEFGRPEYEAAITGNKQELPLLPDKLVLAFSRWDEQIGSQKKK